MSSSEDNGSPPMLELMEGVREHGEGLPVYLEVMDNGRLVIRAENEGGQNCTQVDVEDLMNWMQKRLPDELP